MDTINELLKIDFASVFISVCVILFAIKTISSLFEWFLDKTGIETKWTKSRKEEKAMLLKTSKEIVEIQKKYKEDYDGLIKNNQNLRDELFLYMKELKQDILSINEFIVKDKNEFLPFKEHILESIENIITNNKERDEQIQKIVAAQKEVLAGRINQKYKEYIANGGIPQDEYDEFVNLHTAYNVCHGNSSGDAKFNYCIEHLEIIPSRTSLKECHHK